MIYFQELGSSGRLGNQLFQYAALRGLCLKKNYETAIPDLNSKLWQGQRCLLTEFNIVGRQYSNESISFNYIEPTWREFDPKFFNINDNTNIRGYFQNLYYFEEFEDNIKRELTPKKKYIEKNIKFIEDIKKIYGCEIVSVHLRRGDNMTASNSHLYKNMFNVDEVYFRYFNKAKEVFNGKNVKFLIFTGGNRGDENNLSDMDWCKQTFIGDEYLFSENQKPINDFTRIMLCDHNIISHISSFGWWAAYLNKNPDKIVVAPKYYHPEDKTLIRDKFYPNKYILL